MKTILKFVVIVMCFSTMMFADLNEGFDSVLPAGWAQTNNSTTPGNPWFQGNAGVFTAHSGASNSYIAANYLSNAGLTGNASNWLFAPTQTFNNGDTVSFWTRTEVGGALFNDSLEVLLSTNGSSTALGDFTTVLATIAAGSYPESWTNLTAILSGLGGPTSGRIAFHYVVTDTSVNGDYIGIDDVSVSAVPEPMSCILVGTGLAGMIARRRKLAK